MIDGLRGVIAACLCLCAGAAAAQDAGWSFRVTPYVWAPALDASVAIGRDPPAETSTSVLDILEGALLLTGEARRGDFAILGEFNYLNLGERASGPGGLVSAKLDVEGVMASLAGVYALHDDGRARIEALAGARFWTLDAGVDFANLPKASTNKSWVDPIVGARATYALTERLSAQVMGDVGGFGVGSDFQFEAVARLGWRIDETFTAAAGYRHLAVDFDEDDLLLDMTLTGPFVSLDIVF